MTGFGCAEESGYKVEIRSLNHRFLDIYVKSPSFLLSHELDIRNAVKRRFSRGKIDVYLQIDPRSQSSPVLDISFAGGIYAALKQFQEHLSVPGEIDINTIAHFREIFSESGQEYDFEVIRAVMEKALDAVEEMRGREGLMLSSELMSMSEKLAMMNGEIKGASGRVPAEQKEKFRERISVLVEGTEVDEMRILQEAALIAARMDITEEIARIESHSRQFDEILRSNDIIGRKLDFVLQELNREVNTIASKTGDPVISALTVEMKTVVEQMREQVQNIQ